jgi:proteic killer suppression protein
MIKSFRDGLAEKLFAGDRVRPYQGFAEQAQRRLTLLDTADRLVDLRALPSNRFEALGGDRKGQYSIRINAQWRLCFGWAFRRSPGENDDILFVEGDAVDVEIVDYHR